LADEFLVGCYPNSSFEKDGLLDERKKALAEPILNAEMDHHLGQEAALTRLNLQAAWGTVCENDEHDG